MKKIMAILITLLVTLFCVKGNASSTNNHQELIDSMGSNVGFFDSNNLEIIDPVLNVEYQGETYNYLQMEFADNSDALRYFNNEFNYEISQNTNYSGIITNDNVQQFINDYNETAQSNYENERSGQMSRFYDIYENLDLNNTKRVQISEDDVLTSTEALSIPYFEPEINTITTNAVFNTAAAANYAYKYAVNLNFDYTAWSADCTNFASQIYRAGGKGNTSYWYYNSSNNYSPSWINANKFAKNVVGIDISYSKNYNYFKSKIIDGDFIALDHSSDGIVDHMGYVRDVVILANGTKQIFISQHTNNYNNEINKTNWPSSCNSGTCHIARP